MGTAAATAPSQWRRDSRAARCRQQRGVPSQRLLVRGDDGRAAVERGRESTRAALGAPLASTTMSIVGSAASAGRVVGEWRGHETRIAKVRTQHRHAGESQSFAC